ncbi:RICIN domain-containing protein [Niabella sp. 22666]|uniref:RICIN domain-containing protein n=1 Tax=Niabella sp. 22666 TaxID=3453954 RepID=UPI003F83C3BD
MKKNLLLKNVFGVCKPAAIILAVLVSCKKDVKPPVDGSPQTTPRSVSSGPAVVSAHRVNDLIKVDEIKNENINSLEVDIFVGTQNGQPTCLIGHEAATATGQTLEQYFANLNQKLPGFTSLWLDCKDLNSTANEQLFLSTLKKMDSMYAIKNRVLVESQYIQYLVGFKQLGWAVSFYSNWQDVYGKPPAQQQTALDEMYNKMTTYGIDGISYDAAADTPMKNYFSGKTVGGNPVKMYAWALARYYGETDLSTKLAGYGHLSILLITFNPPQASLIDGANYKIVSALTKEPSKVLDVNGSAPVNGTEVTLWTNNYPTSNNQVFKLRAVGGGYYALKSIADTSKVLDVTGGASANSTLIQVNTFSNSTAQRWQINYVGGGYYNLTPACAPGKNLDVSGGSTTNDTPIIIYSAHTANPQKFKLVKQ